MSIMKMISQAFLCFIWTVALVEAQYNCEFGDGHAKNFNASEVCYETLSYRHNSVIIMSDERFYNLVLQFAGTWYLVYDYPDIFQSVYNVSLHMELEEYYYDALAYAAFSQ